MTHLVIYWPPTLERGAPGQKKVFHEDEIGAMTFALDVAKDGLRVIVWEDSE